MEIIRHAKHGQNMSDFERAASVFAGSLLAIQGLRQGGDWGYVLAALGGEMIRRGATGYCYGYELLGLTTAPSSPNTSVPYPVGVRVDCSVTIDRTPEEVYRFWRNLENLPRFMSHLESVTRVDGRRSHWVAKGPRGRNVEWDAEIINEEANRLIGWRSLEGADVDNAGSVRFEPTPGGGTRVNVELQYNPPAGLLGAAVAKMFGEDPARQIDEDLQSLKQVMESSREEAPAEPAPLGV
jgi:uncharacterized membrane protein